MGAAVEARADAGGNSDACEIAGAGGSGGGALAFGAACSCETECSAGLCAEFGDGTRHCSVNCDADADCPQGTQGRKCNGRGFCAY